MCTLFQCMSHSLSGEYPTLYIQIIGLSILTTSTFVFSCIPIPSCHVSLNTYLIDLKNKILSICWVEVVILYHAHVIYTYIDLISQIKRFYFLPPSPLIMMLVLGGDKRHTIDVNFLI